METEGQEKHREPPHAEETSGEIEMPACIAQEHSFCAQFDLVLSSQKKVIQLCCAAEQPGPLSHMWFVRRNYSGR